jgi:hypothetical protein
MPWIMLFVVAMLFVADRAWYLQSLRISLAGREAPFDEIVASLSWLCLIAAYCFAPDDHSSGKPTFTPVVLGVFASAALSYLCSSVPLYGQPADRLGRVLFWFGGLMVYPALRRVVGPVDGVAPKLMNLIAAYGTISAVFCITASLSSSLQGFMLPEIISERFGMTRVGRIAAEPMMLAFFLYLANITVKRREKPGVTTVKPPIVAAGLAIVVICIVFVAMQRRVILAALLTLLVMSIITLRSILFRKGFCLTLLSAFAGVTLFLGACYSGLTEPPDFAKEFADSLDTKAASSSQDAASVKVRKDGLDFYWSQLLRTGGIGIGWVSQSDDIVVNNEILLASSTGLFVVDLGMLGSIFQYGVIGLIVMVIFFTVAFSRLLLVIRLGNDADRIVGVSLFAYFFCQLISLNNIFFLPGFSFFYGLLFFIIDNLSFRYRFLNKTNTMF